MTDQLTIARKSVFTPQSIEPSDDEALYKLVQRIFHDRFELNAEGLITHPNPATVFLDGGDWVASWRNDEGSSFQAVLNPVDSPEYPQSEIEPESVAQVADPYVEELNGRSTNEIVKDDTLATNARLSALRDWLEIDRPTATDFVLEQLEQHTTIDEWSKMLVYAAEDVTFDSEAFQSRAAAALLAAAKRLREIDDADSGEVVWAAIQRAGSLIPVHEVSELVEFLTPPNVVDTRLAALQAIVHVFEMAPPTSDVDLKALRDQTFDLCSLWFNPNLFIAGEISALAIEGLIALATMGDERLGDLVEAANQLKRDWLSQEIDRRLNEVVGFWAEADGETADLEIRRLCEACGRLHESAGH